MRRAVPLLAVALAVAVAGCGGSGGGDDDAEPLVIAVNAPFSRTPYLGRTIFRGASVAAADLGGQSGRLQLAGKIYELRIRKLDTALSPRRALANVRRAIRDGAVAILDEGTGVDASWKVAAEAGVPIGVVYQGGTDLVDPERRPNVFRVAPRDHGLAFRLAEYLIPKGLEIAVLHDDTGYGQNGAEELAKAFARNRDSVAIDLRLPAGQPDLAPQILRARRSGATALLVWGQPPTIAKVVIAARTARWDVPIYTSPAGADPLVRQSLADHPEWVDGLTFASGRLTAEAGPEPYYVFERKYRSLFGPDYVGVRTSDGARVTQPPEFAMYASDFVHLVVAAAERAADPTDGAAVVRALEEVSIRGANGDERGFNEKSHEAVIDDDVYFARFRDMTYAPVTDDPLSSLLPEIQQRG